MKFFTLTMIASFLLLAAANPAGAQKRKLSDAELDKVTAGGAPAQSNGGVLGFQFQGKAGNTHTVNGSGTVAVTTDAVPLNSATLILQDGAQQNLRSMINNQRGEFANSGAGEPEHQHQFDRGGGTPKQR